MRFYTRQHRHTCGIDLHARTMHLCILGEKGETLLHRNFPTTPEAFLEAVAPFREDLVVGVECMYALAHLHLLNDQYNLPDDLGRIAHAKNRQGLGERVSDDSVAKSSWANLELLERYDGLIGELERYLLAQAKVQDPSGLALLQSMPGIGRILGLTMLYEIHDIQRFPRVQDFASYARLVKCEHRSAGKRKGFGGPKIGNPHLKWAFSEAAVLLSSKSAQAKKLVDRLEKKHGKAEALSIFAHRIGRAVYYRLKKREAFHLPTFLST